MGRPKGSKNKKKIEEIEQLEFDMYDNEPSFLEEMKKEIIGIIIITICVILGLSVFYDVDSETLLGPIHAGLEYLFGWFAFVFPIITIMYTIVVLSDEEKDFNFKYILTLLLLLALISAYPALMVGDSFLEGVKYGGVLGASVAHGLYKIAGTIGGYVILVALSILAFILFTKKSFLAMIKKGANVAAESARNSRERFENRFLTEDEDDYEYDEEYDEEEIDDENNFSFVKDNRNKNFDFKIDEEDDDEEYEEDDDDEEIEDEEEIDEETDVLEDEEQEEEEIIPITLKQTKPEKKRFFSSLRFPKRKEKQRFVEIMGSDETKEDILRTAKIKNEGIVDIAFWENEKYEENDEPIVYTKTKKKKKYVEDDYEDDIDTEDLEEVDEYEEEYEEYEDDEENLYEEDDEEIDDTDEEEYEEEYEEDDVDDETEEVVIGDESSNIVRTKTLKKKNQEVQLYDDAREDMEDAAVDIEEEEEEIEYTYPSIKLLAKPSGKKVGNSKAELKQNAQILESTLQSFGVNAKVLDVTKGPSVTRYELQPERGVKVSKIVNLTDDIALNLAAAGVRIEAPIPGKAAIGIEIANKESTSVLLREVLDSPEFNDAESKLSVCLGKGIDGKPAVIDLAKMPHLLIAGATGSGKSVCINSIITSIIYKANPNEVKLLMVDPKVVELKMYTGIPHLLIPVVTNPKKAASALNWAVSEMLERYKFFADNNVKNLKGYNALMEKEGKKKIPQIVIIIDELADLMMSCPKEVEDSICRLAQMARAAGMHLIIATQRPSVDVITGLIKANIPSRIAFAVSSQIDSRTILDISGAEKLLGKGDMLYYPVGANKPTRIQGAFVSESEVEKVVDFVKGDNEIVYNEGMIEAITARNLKDANSSSSDSDDDEDDDLIDDAIDLIREKKKASITMFQRAFRIGYNRAARLMDELEDKGIVGPEEGTKPRRVLFENIDYDD